jgi:hypothetical protein
MALSSTVMQCSASRAILGTAASGQNERPASRDFANCAVLLTGPLQSFDRLLDQLIIKRHVCSPAGQRIALPKRRGTKFPLDDNSACQTGRGMCSHRNAASDVPTSSITVAFLVDF